MRDVEVSAYSEKQFYRPMGGKRAVFEPMVEVVTAHLKPFGRPRKLSAKEMVLMTLNYWREYRTQFHVGCSFGVSEATVGRTVRVVEAALLQDMRFHLPGKKALYDGSLKLVAVVVDAREQRIERPQKQRRFYSGKKKCHTQKGQLVTDQSTKEILCVQVAKGKTHNFVLFKRSLLPLASGVELLADTDYQGVAKPGQSH